MRRVGLLLGCLALSACGDDDDGANQPPVAALSVDQMIKSIGVPFAFSSTGSDDPDGQIVLYRLVFGDGSPGIATASADTNHAYGRAGVFEVELTVVDDRGAEATAKLTITVTDEIIPPGCQGDDECRPSERCDDGRCVPADPCTDVPCSPPFSCVDGFCRCGAGLSECGDECVDTSADERHCGGCDRPCGDGSTCVAGACEGPGCEPPRTLCPDGICTDLSTDPEHCGSCDRKCESGSGCQDGRCNNCPAGWTDCGGFCTDLTTDPFNCGECFRFCDSFVCEMSMCQDLMCPPGFDDCGGFCADLSSDPFNCGFCGNFCPTFACVDFMCAMGEPGTLLEIYPPPPFQTVRGMTNLFGEWYISTGRRFVLIDLFSGSNLGDWFIQDEMDRRANGLAADDFSGLLWTGAFDRFDPFSPTDLEIYEPFSEFWLSQVTGIGGPVAADGDIMWVFDNLSQELVEVDRFGWFELDRHTVDGLEFGDRFSDLAIDGYGGIWAVRPDVMGIAGPLMKKIDIASMSVVLDVPPPDTDGLGGVVLFDGSLWGASRNGVYRMVP